MAAKARLSYLRVSPQRVKLVADLVRGKGVAEATSILRFTPNRSARPILKLLKSAISNAVTKGDVDTDNLFVSQVLVGPGPIIKRFTTRAMGRGTRVNKRTSHITIVLGER